MCEVCMKSPCDSRCPHAPDPPSVYVCSGCGDDILDGENVWHILGEQFCEECIESMKEVATYDPY